MQKSLIVLALLAVTAFSTQFMPTYSNSSTVQVVYYAKAAACSSDVINTWQCGTPCEMSPGMTEVKSHDDRIFNAQAYTGYDSINNVVVASFRGSQGVINWINNFDFKRLDYDGCVECLVHKGFWDTYESIQTSVIREVKRLHKQFPEAPILSTGHSLGGAMSVFAAMDIALNVSSNVQIINFGQPRVGNVNYAQYMVNLIPNTYRVVHYRDIVPHAPPTRFGYWHMYNEIWYDQESNEYRFCNDSGEDPLCSDSQTILSPADHMVYLGIEMGC